ncbi:MAG: polysaccharide deacetylase family protein [Gammaproteobacteria bacterium]|nr:polysaccharide deacetylase family protein [Gammaproteobacteria bacterium]
MSLRSATVRSLERATQFLGASNRLLVLTYHRVSPVPDPLDPETPDRESFRRLMEVLQSDFNVMPLADALRLQGAKRLPPGTVAITFDDGFADNAKEALGVLSSLGLHATFFVSTGYLDGGCMFHTAVIEACRHAPAANWDTGIAELGVLQPGPLPERHALAQQINLKVKYFDRARRMECAERLLASVRQEVPANVMMRSEDVLRLHRAGMHIGSHTRTHPILARQSLEEARNDIVGGKVDLEAIIGEPVRLFAYPNGRPGDDYGPREMMLVREAGFAAAMTTVWGYSDPATDRYEIPRVGSCGNSRWRFSMRLLSARLNERGGSCLAPEQAAGRF